MEISQRSFELPAGPDNALPELIHVVSRVQRLVEGKLLEDHVVVGERPSLVTEEVLDAA
jgi:hypothetical protein